MRRLLPAILLVIVIAAGLGVYLSRKPPPDAVVPMPPSHTVEVTQPVVEHNEVRLKPQNKPIDPGSDPLTSALTAQLEASSKQESSPIPRGTRLVGVNIRDGVATVELSSEFNDLAKRSESIISMAQNTLRKSLGQFSTVKKMRVLVDGKVFDDDVSGRWEDIPVRDEHAEGEP